jgi:hypothetical protein
LEATPELPVAAFQITGLELGLQATSSVRRRPVRVM